MDDEQMKYLIKETVKKMILDGEIRIDETTTAQVSNDGLIGSKEKHFVLSIQEKYSGEMISQDRFYGFPL